MTPAFSGSTTEVLLLGSLHLDAGILDQALAQTVERLTAWASDVIGVEILPGELVDLYERQGGWLDELTYGRFPLARRLGRIAQELTGWTRAEAARLAADSSLEAEQRVLAHVSAFEPWNALLLWTPDLKLPTLIDDNLRALAQSPAESVRLGEAVARCLGHSRLCLFDDFPTGEMPAEMWAESGFGAQSPEFQARLAAHPFIRAQAEASKALDYWDVLRWLNQPETVSSNDDLESSANLRLDLAGRIKQADWEARNLYMAGVHGGPIASGHHAVRGRTVAGHRGASHKGRMESALSSLGADVRLVELDEVEENRPVP